MRSYENLLRLSSPAGLAVVDTANMPAGQRWVMPPHLDIINQAMIEAAEGEWDFVLISTPPRHGKSMLVSHFTPAWFRLRYPHRRIILTSYEATFAQMWGTKARDAFSNNASQLGFELKKDQRSGKHWETQGYVGAMYTAGVGGPITGKGADLFIIDDPIKNSEEALSMVMREKMWDWYGSTARSRIEPGGCLFLMMTRWHEDDLYGRLLASLEGSDKRVKIINFPALAEADDPLGRQPGEALWPSRYSREELLSIKSEIGSQWFNALYQGRPSPEEGGIFKRAWFQVRPNTKRIDYDFTVISVDATFKDTSDGSYVVGQVWGVSGVQRHLLDQVRDRIDFVDTCTMIKRLYSKWRPDATLIEDKANGPAVISQLKDTIPGMVPIAPEGSKEARAHAASPVVEAGNVFLPEDLPWVGDFVEECCAFPNAMYDDQVDCMTQAINYLKRFEAGAAPKVKDKGGPHRPDGFGPRRRPKMR